MTQFQGGGLIDVSTLASSLGLILLILAILAIGARFLNRRLKILKKIDDLSIDIIAARSFGWNAQLLVISVAGQLFLVSRNRSGIQPISQLTDQKSSSLDMIE
ncbi:MAG: hypothetical protein B7Z75_06995 [Acidocella sp. 20-57-95]|nr:MAG: hypothetical protein B7Z75_06995 [Acidocella sp. 20-57-95]HQT63579.1 hypothetical protein [Acidocella sp.]